MSDFEIEERHPEFVDRNVARNCGNCIFYKCVVPGKKVSMGVCNESRNENDNGTRPYASGNDEPCRYHVTRKECDAINADAMRKNAKANALISAAPEMLKILEWLLETLPSIISCNDEWDEQRAGMTMSRIAKIVKKARGEE